MAESIGNISTIVISIGLLSSVVDNVPLVAATQGMYDLAQYPTDHFFWEFLAYCAGTGGSALIIGSAAGVAAMGMEKINFFLVSQKNKLACTNRIFLRGNNLYSSRFNNSLKCLR